MEELGAETEGEYMFYPSGGLMYMFKYVDGVLAQLSVISDCDFETLLETMKNDYGLSEGFDVSEETLERQGFSQAKLWYLNNMMIRCEEVEDPRMVEVDFVWTDKMNLFTEDTSSEE